MKHVLILAVVVLSIFSCSNSDPREPFLGIWKIEYTSVHGEFNTLCQIEAKGSEEMVWTIKTNRTQRYKLRINDSNSKKASTQVPGIPILLYQKAEVRLDDGKLLASITSHNGIQKLSYETFVLVRP